MLDREKVIKGLEICTTRPCYCTDCPYKANCVLDSQELMEDALALLKDDETQLQYRDDHIAMYQAEVKRLEALLKEQEAVEPRRDANCVRMFRCGVCGEYVGFIDSDTGDPNEQDNYCRNCGRKVKWNE